MIKVANNLQKLVSSPLVIGTGVGLLGGGLGAGLFHLLANKEKRTLINYLLAATAGAVPTGYVAGTLTDSINTWKAEKELGNPDMNPSVAIEQEAESAKTQGK